jgi:cytochrome c-type biogenesis protein CcmF
MAIPKELLKEPPLWGMVLGAIGKGAVWFGFTAFLLSALSHWRILHKEKATSPPLARHPWSSAFFFAGCVSVGIAFVCLLALLLGRQYQYHYVWTQTENDMPFIFRLSAAWSAQEGSFLLWTLTSVLMSLILLRHTGAYRTKFLCFLSLPLSALCGVLAYESPFKLTAIGDDLRAVLPQGQSLVMPPDGLGMNPVLLNYWMAIHPWVIFIGFGSLMPLFAWCAAVIFSRDWHSWIHPIRPWAIFATTVLGLGISLGGLWAYETLGWGGFWAWDPVENASLVPFLFAAAFTHTLFLAARGQALPLSLWFGLLPFASFVYGTYLTRSGALVNVSVHSFAEMNQGAHRIMLGVVLAVAGFVVFCALKVKRQQAQALHPPHRVLGARSKALLFGVMVLSLIALMAGIGMSVPFFASVFNAFTQKNITVRVIEETTYNRFGAFLYLPLFLLMAIAPFLGWTKTDKGRFQVLANCFLTSAILFAGIVFFLMLKGLTMSPSGKMPTPLLLVLLGLIWIALFSITANAWRFWERWRARAGGVGGFLFHCGVSILLLGLIVSRGFQKEVDTAITPNVPAVVEPLPSQLLALRLNALPPDENQWLKKDNFLDFALEDLRTGSKLPVKPNFYLEHNTNTGAIQIISRPAIKRTPLYDLYFVVTSFEFPSNEFTLKPGETKEVNGYTISYLQPTREGEPGQAGTRFGALLEVKVAKTSLKVRPELQIGEGGRVHRHPASIAPGINVWLESLDARDHTASLSLVESEPVFRAKLYITPLSLLVWLGTGMMTLGGFLALRKRLTPAHSLSQNEAD